VHYLLKKYSLGLRTDFKYFSDLQEVSALTSCNSKYPFFLIDVFRETQSETNKRINKCDTFSSKYCVLQEILTDVSQFQ